MKNSILVAFATKHGATAERIAAVLEKQGFTADLKPANDVRDVSDYAAVVIGSAVYMGQWRRSAVKLVRKQQDALAQKPVWIFSSGPTNYGDVNELLEGWTQPNNLKEVFETIQPREIAVFHGDLDPATLSGLEKWIINKVKAPTGDFRDWEMIESWAAQIADALQ